MKVVDAIARILKVEGAEFLSAYPTTPVIEAAARTDVRPVLCRQERLEFITSQETRFSHRGALR